MNQNFTIHHIKDARNNVQEIYTLVNESIDLERNVTLKVYFGRSGEHIRRATKVLGDICSYESLRSFACGLFNGAEKNCRMCYVDDEGDDITMDDSDDLMECLEMLGESKVLKIKVFARWGFGRRVMTSEGLHVKGMNYMGSGNYMGALKMFLKQANLRVNNLALYNAACAASCANEIELACILLERAFKFGFDSVNHMESDSDLDNIRCTHAYKSLLAAHRPKPQRTYFDIQNEAFALMDNGDFDSLKKAVKCFEEVLVSYPNDRFATYNTACAYSLMGMLDKSLEKLNEAIALGYDNWDNMEVDEDLVNVRLLEDFPTRPVEKEVEKVEPEIVEPVYEPIGIFYEPEVIKLPEIDIIEPEPEHIDEIVEEIVEEPIEEKKEQDDDTVNALAAMGFSVDRVKLALNEADQDTNVAIELLLGC